jgi:hypothetical protein
MGAKSTLTRSNVPGLHALLLHGHSICPFLPDVTQKTHLFAAVFSCQAGSVAAFHVNAPTLVTWLPGGPSDLFGLEWLEIGAPVHVSRRAATVSAVQPKVVHGSIRNIY